MMAPFWKRLVSMVSIFNQVEISIFSGAAASIAGRERS
jgi:hypothetical protein